MKFNAISVSLVAGLAAATPTPTIEKAANNANVKRASVSDVCRPIELPNFIINTLILGSNRYLCLYFHSQYITYFFMRIRLSERRNYWRCWRNYHYCLHLCAVHSGSFRECRKSSLPRWCNFPDSRPSKDWQQHESHWKKLRSQAHRSRCVSDTLRENLNCRISDTYFAGWSRKSLM